MVLAVTAAMTLILGVTPAVFVDWARHASLMLLISPRTCATTGDGA